MLNYAVNNFTKGEVSPKLAGRYDLNVYHNGVKTLENFLPMLQGGVTRRPGTEHVGDLTDPCRLIPFIVSTSQQYMIELSDKLMRIWDSGTPLAETYGEEDGAVWTDSILNEIQFAQDYQGLYLVHRSFPPKVLRIVGSALVFGTMVFTCDESGDYTSLFSAAGEYPGCVAYCSNRLWFASSHNNPYRLWASRPFDVTNFTTFDVVETETEVIKPGSEWGEDWTEDPSSITETQIENREVTPADAAMVLEVGSNRNDRIEWLTAGRNIIVGTASSEWIIPGNIDALNPQTVHASAYGSASIQGLAVNEDVLFIQSGGKRCRAYVTGSEGYSSPDLTFTADHILSEGVKEMHFQRVPEPRVYFVMENGDLVVLLYNKLYDLQAWSRWTFDGEVVSLAVIDTFWGRGQEVYLAVRRGDSLYLEYLAEGDDIFTDRSNMDEPIQYTSRFISNRIDIQTDGGVTIGKNKRISSVVFRLLNSGGLKAGYTSLEEFTADVDEGDRNIMIGGGYEKELRMTVESVEDKPLTILAMVYEMEVG